MNQNFNFPLSFGSVAIWSWPSYNISPTWISLKEGHFPCYSLPFRGPGRVSGRYFLDEKDATFASKKRKATWFLRFIQGAKMLAAGITIYIRSRGHKMTRKPQTMHGFFKGKSVKITSNNFSLKLDAPTKLGCHLMPATYIQPVTKRNTEKLCLFPTDLYTSNFPKIPLRKSFFLLGAGLGKASSQALQPGLYWCFFFSLKWDFVQVGYVLYQM